MGTTPHSPSPYLGSADEHKEKKEASTSNAPVLVCDDYINHDADVSLAGLRYESAVYSMAGVSIVRDVGSTLVFQEINYFAGLVHRVGNLKRC
jgi:hypothetical protein